MKTMIDPGKERRSINFVDNICFSHVTDLAGQPLELYMSLMLQNGNSEMRSAAGRDDEVSTGRQPVIVWINGSGWRGADKNLMAAEMQFLAEAGFALACIDYRSSAKGHFREMVTDCKTAVRFLRANADKYGLDADHIGCIGRSAGGHLTSWMAMNTDGFDSEEYAGVSSKIQAAVDMFGPTDIPICTRINMKKFADPNFRWHCHKDTHEGAMLGVTDDMTDEQVLKLGWEASPISAINEGMCPLTILHGDQDPLVPLEVSESFYNALCKAGLESRTDFYVLKNGGHGTREFFQPMTKQIIADFFTKVLRG